MIGKGLNLNRIGEYKSGVKTDAKFANDLIGML